MARPVAPARPPRQAPQSPVRRRLSTRRAKLATRVLLALATTFIFVIGWSLGHALTYPGGGSVPQRVAEWARNHYMGPLVTFGEWLIYTPPKVGGKPTFNLNKLGGSTVSRTKVKPKHHGIVPIIPPNIPAPAGLPPYPGEGASQSYGLQVAALAGVPAPVISRARRYLQQLEAQAVPHTQQGDLFSVPAEPAEAEANPALEALLALDPDSLTPRQALDELYRLRTLLNS